MRVLLACVSGLVLIGADDGLHLADDAQSAPLDEKNAPIDAAPSGAAELDSNGLDEEASAALREVLDANECGDQITKARSDARQPQMEREPASPDKPYLIYAIDRKENGCSVMVMMGDTEDIRALPSQSAEPLQVIPAAGE